MTLELEAYDGYEIPSGGIPHSLADWDGGVEALFDDEWTKVSMSDGEWVTGEGRKVNRSATRYRRSLPDPYNVKPHIHEVLDVEGYGNWIDSEQLAAIMSIRVLPHVIQARLQRLSDRLKSGQAEDVETHLENISSADFAKALDILAKYADRVVNG